MSDNIDDGCWENGKPIYGIDCVIIHNGCRSVGYRISHSEQWEIVNIGGAEFPFSSRDVKFEPIKTDRELAIEEMAKLMSKGAVGTYMSVAEKLYDAGYRKNES